MSSFEDDERHIRHFLAKTEASIRDANIAAISPLIPEVTEASVIQLAKTVASLRGRYLEAVFHMAENVEANVQSDAAIEKVRHYRAVYEEARKGFEELTHAIERGYIRPSDLT